MKKCALEANLGQIMENIGSLNDFLGPAEDSPTKNITVTNTFYINSSTSRINTPSPCIWTSRKTPDSRFSPLKSPNQISFASKTLEPSQLNAIKVKNEKNPLTDRKSPLSTRPQTCTPDYSRIKSRVSAN